MRAVIWIVLFNFIITTCIPTHILFAQEENPKKNKDVSLAILPQEEITKIVRSRLDQIGKLKKASTHLQNLITSYSRPKRRGLKIDRATLLTRALPRFEHQLLQFRDRLIAEVTTQIGPEEPLTDPDYIGKARNKYGDQFGVELGMGIFQLLSGKAQLLEQYFYILIEYLRIQALAGALSLEALSRFNLPVSQAVLNNFGIQYLPKMFNMTLRGNPQELTFTKQDNIYVFSIHPEFLRGIELGAIASKSSDFAFFNFVRFIFIQKLYYDLAQTQTLLGQAATLPALPESLVQSFQTLGLNNEIHRIIFESQKERDYRYKLFELITQPGSLRRSLLTEEIAEKLFDILVPDLFKKHFESSREWNELFSKIKIYLDHEKHIQQQRMREFFAPVFNIFPLSLLHTNLEELPQTIRKMLEMTVNTFIFNLIGEIQTALQKQFLKEILENPISALKLLIVSWKNQLEEDKRAGKPEDQIQALAIEELEAKLAESIILEKQGKTEEVHKLLKDYFSDDNLKEYINKPFEVSIARALVLVSDEGKKFHTSTPDSVFRIFNTQARTYSKTVQAQNRQEAYVKDLIKTSKELSEKLQVLDDERTAGTHDVNFHLLDLALSADYQNEKFTEEALQIKKVVIGKVNPLTGQYSPTDLQKTYVAHLSEYIAGFYKDCGLHPRPGSEFINHNGEVKIKLLEKELSELNLEKKAFASTEIAQDCLQRKLTVSQLLKFGLWFGLTRPTQNQTIKLGELSLSEPQKHLYRSRIIDSVVNFHPILAVKIKRPSHWNILDKFFDAITFKPDTLLFEFLGSLQGTPEEVFAVANGITQEALQVIEQNIHKNIAEIAAAKDIEDLKNLVAIPGSYLVGMLMREEYALLSQYQKEMRDRVFTPSAYTAVSNSLMRKYWNLALIQWIGPALIGYVFPPAKPYLYEVKKWISPFFSGWIMGTLFAADTTFDVIKIRQASQKQDYLRDFFISSSTGPALFDFIFLEIAEQEYHSTLNAFVFQQAFFALILGGVVGGPKLITNAYQWFNESKIKTYFRQVGFKEGEFSWNETAIQRIAESARAKVRMQAEWDSLQINDALHKIDHAERYLISRIQKAVLRLEGQTAHLAFEFERLNLPPTTRDFKIIRERFEEIRQGYQSGQISAIQYRQAESAYQQLKAVFQPEPSAFTKAYRRIRGEPEKIEADKSLADQDVDLNKYFWDLLNLRASKGRKISETDLGGHIYREATIDPEVYK